MTLRFLFGAMFLLYVSPLTKASAILPDRGEIDGWLKPLGADNHFDPQKGINWGIVPGPFYTPELGAGIGAAVVGMYRTHPQDTADQNSVVTISGYTSSTGALGINLQNYSFFPGDRWRVFLNGKLNNTPSWYWGPGFSAGKHKNHRQKYTAREISLSPEILRRLWTNSYFGLGWDFSSFHAAKPGKGPRLVQNAPGGPSLLNSGMSFQLLYDSRDFIANPSRGRMFSLSDTVYTPELGSDSRFNVLTTRYSQYHAFTSRDTLAWEVSGEFTSGSVPWISLPTLGSSQRMRGYYPGRYRSRDTLSGQVEYRRRLAWRHGVVAWLGGGTMGSDMDALSHSRWLPSVGVGYRFAFKPKMNVRLDYGVGQHSSSFYFQVGEAF
nr:BamA/TamA family outer membrane protein [Pantoea sp. 201603H]